jgi:DNA-binding CsgD family transcriptional regulator
MRPRKSAINTLSRREKQCLLWAARGKGYIEISMIEGIAYGTVKTYLDSARLKLNCATLAAATALAVGRGLLTLEEIEGPL